METQESGLSQAQLTFDSVIRAACLANAEARKKHAVYGWIITEDHTDGNLRKVEIFGPGNIDPHFQMLLRHNVGEPFELYDDDKQLYYRGRIVGEYSGFEPQDDFGEPNAGACHTKMKGDWL